MQKKTKRSQKLRLYTYDGSLQATARSMGLGYIAKTDRNYTIQS